MKPTKRQETVMAVIVVLIIHAFLFLTSCSTKKTITEYVTVHDTTYISRSDTISEREWERLWQKIHELESARHNESHRDFANKACPSFDATKEYRFV